MKIFTDTLDTRENNEDFALTPYLSSVFFSEDNIKVYGIAITWGYKSFAIFIGYNIPKKYFEKENTKTIKKN